MASSKRLDRRVSALALHGLLIDVLSDVAKHDESTLPIKALRSQGALARIDIPAAGIRACSLNTLKATANRALEGGFVELNRVRLQLLRTLESRHQTESAGAHRNKNALLQRIETLESEKEHLLQDLFLLQRAFDIRCRQAFQYANSGGDSAVVELCKRQHRDVLQGLTLMYRKNVSTVVSIRRKRTRET